MNYIFLDDIYGKLYDEIKHPPVLNKSCDGLHAPLEII